MTADSCGIGEDEAALYSTIMTPYRLAGGVHGLGLGQRPVANRGNLRAYCNILYVMNHTPSPST